MNYLVFDRNFVFLNGGYVQVSTAAKEDGTNVPFEETYGTTYSDQPAGLCVHLFVKRSNFADRSFTSMILPYNRYTRLLYNKKDFYPFGLSFNSYQREKSLANNYLYNGKEQINDLNLDWEDFGARMYMPEIGRWGVIDPLSEQARSWGPYKYAMDNPIPVY